MQGIPERHTIRGLQKCQELDLELVEVSIKCPVGPKGVGGCPETQILGFLVPIPDTENANL